MSQSEITFEAVKLVAQFLGALVIARLAVGWALVRYKSEKTWERRLTAYADAVSAIGEMQAVVGQWYDEAIERREPAEEYQAFQQERFRSARRRLDEGVANALLLLPKETADLLLKLKSDLEEAGNASSLEEHLDRQYGAMKRAMETLITQGRQGLRID